MSDMFHKIFTLENHQEIKPFILSSIEQFASSSIHNKNDSISRTDWNIEPDVPRAYFEFIKPFISNEYYEFAKYLGCRRLSIDNFWFQQYYKMDNHKTHCHPGTNFSNIYYLELTNPSQRTEFYNPVDKTFFQFDVKEGDVLTFPAYYVHRSPVNTTNDRKTVIVFNSSIEI